MFLMWLSGTRLHTKLLLTVPALASSSAFSLPSSCVSFYPFKMYCVFVCKFGESFMAVIDGLVCVFYWREPEVQIGCRSRRLFVGC